MEALKILQTAKKKIADKTRWCQGTLYATATGRPTSKERAKRCCAYGAVLSVAKVGENFVVPGRYLTEAATRLNKDIHISFVTYNDVHEHKDVVKMFNLAIKLAREAAK